MVCWSPGGLAHRRFQVWDPKTWQLAVEYIVDYIENLIRDTTGHAMPELVPYLTTMISYILLANLLSTFPLLSSPTRDLNTTLALSVVSFGSWHYYGIQKRLGPIPAFPSSSRWSLLPPNILGLVSRVVSMALRLFGNVIAGEMISRHVHARSPCSFPAPECLGMITGVLQALVFTVHAGLVVDAMVPRRTGRSRPRTQHHLESAKGVYYPMLPESNCSSLSSRRSSWGRHRPRNDYHHAHGGPAVRALTTWPGSRVWLTVSAGSVRRAGHPRVVRHLCAAHLFDPAFANPFANIVACRG